MTTITRRIHINGIVQGVGFRPFIYNQAKEASLTGWVRNSASGVDIEVSGTEHAVNQLIEAIQTTPPPLSQIDDVTIQPLPPKDFTGFKIIHSQDKTGDFIPISPDVATCADCRRELFDPQDHRYRYPFINCTNCGPRFSIIKEIPYDRPKTTMAGFDLCPTCQAEYDSPSDRRFHAQPVACPACGPYIWLQTSDGQSIADHDEAIQTARKMLKTGKILAIKGLGGFHLACDATNPDAVARLRERKHRPAKPFALMAFDTTTIEKYVHVSEAARALLQSPQSPIVLMPRRKESAVAENTAPGQANLGMMLPYTPLHLLLLEPVQNLPEVLVMTSGNLSEEPILHTNTLALEKLGPIADAFLLHNRPIYRRIDDSVVNLMNDDPVMVRRARGYAPTPFLLPEATTQTLALGPQMKNTFCLTRDRYAFLSHHIGEMDNWETFQDFTLAVQQYQDLFRIDPELIVCDLHPNYNTTKYAYEIAQRKNLPLIQVQHHHAHLAVCAFENKIPPQKTIAGLIFDGTGYGTDGTIWGGEVLVGNLETFERAYHLAPNPLAGGDLAIRKPARMALSVLWALGLPWEESLAPVQALSEIEKKALLNQLEHGVNTITTSSMGRLFDTVSALLGLRSEITYEAQAAIELEAVAAPDITQTYPWEIADRTIQIRPLIEAILDDLNQRTTKEIISAKFHNTIAAISLDLCQRIKDTYGVDQIALSGGVWQNKTLFERTTHLLIQKDFHPLVHHATPPNDGCVALGQALMGAYRFQKQTKE